MSRCVVDWWSFVVSIVESMAIRAAGPSLWGNLIFGQETTLFWSFERQIGFTNQRPDDASEASQDASLKWHFLPRCRWKPDFYVFFPSKTKEVCMVCTTLLALFSGRQLARQETEEVFQALAAVASYEKKRRLRRRSNVKSQTGISWSTSRFPATHSYMLPMWSLWIWPSVPQNEV